MEALKERVEKILRDVVFDLSDDGYGNPEPYKWLVKEGHGGLYLQGVYSDLDIYPPNEWKEQTTRKWLLSPHMTDSEIVQTAFKLCMTSYEHRVREAFKYKGARIFGPHFNVEDLVKLCKDGKEDAGGRQKMSNSC